MRKFAVSERSSVLALLSLGALTAPTSAAVIISDLNNVSPDFQYNSFPGNTSVQPTFFRVSTPANQFGGSGFNLASPLNISTQTTLAVSGQIGTGNLNVSFNVLLQDSDGTQFGYSFPMSSFNASGFTSAYVELGSPSFSLSAGSMAGLNLASITQFQLQGNFSGSETVLFAFDFDSVAAVPEPTSLALLATSTVLLRRRRSHR